MKEKLRAVTDAARERLAAAAAVAFIAVVAYVLFPIALAVSAAVSVVRGTGRAIRATYDEVRDAVPVFYANANGDIVALAKTTIKGVAD